MTRFALNYSPQAADLLRAGQIEIDLFKCPAWPDLIAEAQVLRPVYIHFSFIAGQHNLEKAGIEGVAAFQSQTETPYVNTHLGVRFSDLADPEDADEVLETMLQDVTPMTERFGAERVILENVPFPDVYLDKPGLASDPGVVCAAVERSGCGLLLDLAHARLSAESLGIDVYAYIEQLPLNHLRELHVTGVGLDPTGFRQDHLPMTDEDWALFDWAMRQIVSGAWPAPWAVSCEYGGIGPMFEWRSDPAVIARDIPRMAAAVRETLR